MNGMYNSENSRRTKPENETTFSLKGSGHYTRAREDPRKRLRTTVAATPLCIIAWRPEAALGVWVTMLVDAVDTTPDVV